MAVTLITAVVSSVNPGYFAGLNAFARDNEDASGGSYSGSASVNDNDNQTKDDSNDHNSTSANTKQYGNENERNGTYGLKTEENGVELQIELQGLNMTDGSYNATFACEEPNLNMTLDNAFKVHNGTGELEKTVGLTNGTYSGCDLFVQGKVLVSFDKFTVNHDSEKDQYNQVDEKRKERKEQIISTINGTRIHERHRNANPASPGEYAPNWNYTLEAAGVAHSSGHDVDDKNTTTTIDLSVWKSNSALILLDVMNGTVNSGNETYTIKIGYMLYSVHHNVMKLAALAVDDHGDIVSLKVRGTAVNEDDEFPMESGSIKLALEGNGSPLQYRFGDWELTLNGTVSAG